MSLCANHSDRKSYAKGLCKSCYNRSLRENNPEYAERLGAYFKKHYAKNSEGKKAASKAWSEANKDRKLHADAIYRANNSDRISDGKKRWRKQNFARVLADNAARRAVTKLATPSWADKSLIADVYEEARYMQMHVDHIIPLKHPKVCGLHVWDNLQLLSPEENMRKNNKFDLEGAQCQ